MKIIKFIGFIIAMGLVMTIAEKISEIITMDMFMTFIYIAGLVSAIGLIIINKKERRVTNGKSRRNRNMA